MNEGLKASSQGGLISLNIRQDDFFFLLAKGEIEGATEILKFGHNLDVDTGSVPEDLWDAGDVWVPPTTARVHNLASTSANDAATGTGARTVEITGLTSYDRLPVSETVTLNGLTDVPTLKAYVVIYRMEALTFGGSQVNEGDVTATAVVDLTVTAEIGTGFGSTLMAIFAIPSLQTLQLTGYYMGWSRNTQQANNADLILLVNRRPDETDGGFVYQHHLALFGSGNTYIPHKFKPYLVIPGPAIVKLQVENVSANNTRITGGFAGIVVDN